MVVFLEVANLLLEIYGNTIATQELRSSWRLESLRERVKGYVMFEEGREEMIGHRERERQSIGF